MFLQQNPQIISDEEPTLKMCRHVQQPRRRSTTTRTPKNQSCIQCAFQRQFTLVEERDDDDDHEALPSTIEKTVPVASSGHTSSALKYRTMSDGEYRVEIYSFVKAFSITECQLTLSNAISNVHESIDPDEVWVTVHTSRLSDADGALQLLNPKNHPFFYKFVRGEYCYGFAHESSMHHAVNRRLYIFKFESLD